MSDIEARLVLRAQLGDAIKALGELQRDLKQIATEAGLVGKAATTGVGQVGQAAKDAATAQTTAAREATQAEAAEAAKRAAIEAEEAARRKAAAAQAERDAKAKAKALAQAAKEQAEAEKKIRDAAEKEAREAANRSRMLAPQLTDIVVGLSTGQSPFTVLLQQGGQLKDLFGGIGNAAKALASVFTPVRILLGGVAAAIGLVATAAVQGYRQSDELRKMLALTGNAAGVSAASIEESSKRIGASQQASIASVREAITAGASLGVFMSATLDSAARAAVTLSKLTGKAAAEQIADFAAMADGVADWAVKANRSYNFLTAAEFSHIRSLEASGSKQEAMRLVMDKLNATIEQRSVPAVGTLEKAWNKLTQKLSDAFDKLRSIGRDQTIEERIEQLKQLDAELALPGADKASQNRRAAIQKEIESLNRLRNAEALRRSEQSINAQAAQDDIERKTEAFQAAQAATEKAAYALRIQNRANALEAERAQVEQANADGLLRQQEYIAKTNELDVKAARLTIDQIQKEISIEKARTIARPIDKEAQAARLLELEKQLRQQEGAVKQIEARGRSEIAARNLEEARDDAQEWGRIWQTAFDQVIGFRNQNAEAAARRITDPIARADEEVKARLEGTRKQIDALKRDLANVRDKTTDADQRKALQDTLDALSRETGPALEELSRSAKFESLRSQASEQLDAIRVKQDALTQQERTGAITTLEAEQQKRDARESAIPVLETILKALDAIKASAADTTAVESLRNSIEDLKVRANDLDQLARRTLAQGFTTFFEDVATGAERADKAALKFLANVAKAALNLIAQNLGQQLADSLIPNKGSGGILKTIGSFFSDSFGTFTLHSGGVVGVDGAARTAPLTAFLGAPRYHSGGIAGLRPNEVPAILEAGEEVLRADSPRHRNNYKGAVSVGDINVSVSVQGGDGSIDGKGFAGRLGEAFKRTVYEVLADESREGGMLDRSRQ